AAFLLHDAGSLLGVTLLVQVGDEHVRALARERQGDGPADAAVAPGDEGRLALQLPAAAVRLLAVVRPRPHLRLEAGRLLLLRRVRRLRPALAGILGHRRSS